MPANLQNAFADATDDDVPPSPSPEDMVADVEQGADPNPAALERDERERIAAEERAANPPEDERLAEGGDPAEEEPEAETPHKRTARERRDARKRHMRALEERNERLEREILELKQGFQNLQGTSLQTQLSTVDARLSECLNDIDQADHLWLAARTANNPADELKAQKVRDEARNRAGSLQAERERLASELTRQQNQPPPQLPVPQGDPVVVSNAARFRADKPWIQFGPQSRAANQETQVALLIERQLLAEGEWDAHEPSFWEELDKRIRVAMPRLFPKQQAPIDDEEDDDEELDETPPARTRPPAPANNRPREQRRRGPAVGGSGRNSGGNREGTRLSAEVVAAIKEAGWWEDPKERADAIKYFTRGK